METVIGNDVTKQDDNMPYRHAILEVASPVTSGDGLLSDWLEMQGNWLPWILCSAVDIVPIANFVTSSRSLYCCIGGNTIGVGTMCCCWCLAKF